MLVVVTHVVGGPQRLLNQFVVRVQKWEALHFRKDLAAELALMPRAIGSNLHAVIWTANGDEVANRERRVARLGDEAANECALRNSDHVELSLAEHWVLQNLFARLFRLLDHRREDRCLDAVANLNALNNTASALPYFIYIFDDFLVVAALLEAVEDGRWHGLVRIGAGATLRHEVLVGMSLGFTMLQALRLRLLSSSCFVHFSGLLVI